jgi:hypothetical protein
VLLRHRLHWDVGHALEPTALPEKAKYGADKNKVLVDRLRPEVRRKRTLEGIERRSIADTMSSVREASCVEYDSQYDRSVERVTATLDKATLAEPVNERETGVG